MPTTRLVTLLRRPDRAGPGPGDFAVEKRPIPALQPGQLLLRNIVLSVDPSMRGRLETSEKHYTTNFKLGEPLDGLAIGVVLEANRSHLGPRRWSATGWMAGSRPGRHRDRHRGRRRDASPAGAWLGVLGQTGFTAYVGLRRTAEMRPGDTEFISAAAGAVGSAAGRFAKLRRHRACSCAARATPRSLQEPPDDCQVHRRVDRASRQRRDVHRVQRRFRRGLHRPDHPPP